MGHTEGGRLHPRTLVSPGPFHHPWCPPRGQRDEVGPTRGRREGCSWKRGRDKHGEGLERAGPLGIGETGVAGVACGWPRWEKPGTPF